MFGCCCCGHRCCQPHAAARRFIGVTVALDVAAANTFRGRSLDPGRPLAAPDRAITTARADLGEPQRETCAQCRALRQAAERILEDLEVQQPAPLAGGRSPCSHCGIILTRPRWAATSSPESLATLRSYAPSGAHPIPSIDATGATSRSSHRSTQASSRTGSPAGPLRSGSLLSAPSALTMPSPNVHWTVR